MDLKKYLLYVLAFVIANFLVLKFGALGLLFSSLFLIPFDFIMRCVFHESYKGLKLILKLFLLVFIAAIITYLINYNTKMIVIASVIGFTSAQIGAGIFYQLFLNKHYLIKVNGSDFTGIIIDSFLFQLIAFSYIDYKITIGQITLKIIGGLFWYWIFFKKIKIQKIWE